MTAADLLRTAYEGLVRAADAIADEGSWSPTGCLGWSVRDLTHHCLSDAQRALVALHTPAGRAPDTDSVDYWRGWGSDPERDDLDRRHGRVQASLYRDWNELRALHAGTARAAVSAAAEADPDLVVATQGHAITVEDLLHTLALEAAVHHLDLVRHRPGAPGPAAEPLAEARRVLDALGPAAFPEGWTDTDVVLVGSGRATPTDQQRDELGPLADRLPLFS